MTMEGNKSSIISITKNTLKTILAESGVREALNIYVNGGYKEDDLEVVAHELTIRAIKYGLDPVSIEVYLAKGGQARKKSVSKKMKEIEGVNLSHVSYLNHLIKELRCELFNIPKQAISPIKEHDKSQYTKLLTLYRELEEIYPAFEGKGYIRDRMDFYDKYLRLVLKPRNHTIHALYEYVTKSKAVSVLVEQQKANNDSNKPLTLELIKFFVEHTKRNPNQVAKFVDNIKYYYKFMCGIQALAKIVKEKDKEGNILSFFELTESKQIKYIKNWVFIHLEAYNNMYSDHDDDVEIGFIAGAHPESYQNALRRFKKHFDKKTTNKAGSSLPKRKLDSWT